MALSQFVMVWVLAAMYLRRADKVFDPLAERAAERALELSGAEADTDGQPAARRFDPALVERAEAERAEAARAAATRSTEVRR